MWRESSRVILGSWWGMGLLARCTVDIAQQDMGLNASLEPVGLRGERG